MQESAAALQKMDRAIEGITAILRDFDRACLPFAKQIEESDAD